MPRICFVPGCRTHKAYYERGVAMFSYPRSDPELLVAWNKACSRAETFEPPRHACVCEKHFEPSEITDKTTGRATLQREAVPSRFLDGWKPNDTPKSISDSNTFLKDDDKEPIKTNKIIDAVISNKSKIFQVEEVFLETNSEGTMISEVNQLFPDMCCRMCGIKHDGENIFNIQRDFPKDKYTEALLSLCLEDGGMYKTTEEICVTCYQQVNSFLEFIKICHIRQRNLLELSIKETGTHEKNSSCESNNLQPAFVEENSNEGLSDVETFEINQMEDEHLDNYIDKLIENLKIEKRRSNCQRYWECLDCRNMFQHRHRLADHRRTCPLVGSVKSKRYGTFICKLCDKVFKTLPGYRHHLLKMHDRDKIQASGSDTHSSKIVHESDDNYPEELRVLKSRKTVVCPICSDTFETSGDLRYHLPSHKSMNRDKSRTIGRSFNSEGKDYDSKQHMCSFCGKMERSNAGLEIHMKFHLKQKDWACELCDKQYYTKADLRQHVLTVHEKRTFTCEECGTVLNSKITFSRHRRLHNESELKQCNFCSKKFTTNNALKRHVQKRHLSHTRPRTHSIEMPMTELTWEENNYDDEMMVDEKECADKEKEVAVDTIKKEQTFVTG
ncbi:zinc finger imprinted 3-like [Malaya genurostris]|uniref:zinc finger imprinted 3-like n=1 Tax=Malaya genurostris TaxID=325434 RepID=UPI0026F3E052|nr:zinc finger imprinted 3-like [Malaya genurostris]